MPPSKQFADEVSKINGPKMAHNIVSNLIPSCDSIIAEGSRMVLTVLNQFDYQYGLDWNDEQFLGNSILDLETTSANCFSNCFLLLPWLPEYL